MSETFDRLMQSAALASRQQPPPPSRRLPSGPPAPDYAALVDVLTQLYQIPDGLGETVLRPDEAAQGLLPTGSSLVRGLGLREATASNVVTMIGSAIFVTLPLVLSAMGGPQAILAGFLGMVISLADGLVRYSRLADTDCRAQNVSVPLALIKSRGSGDGTIRCSFGNEQLPLKPKKRMKTMGCGPPSSPALRSV